MPRRLTAEQRRAMARGNRWALLYHMEHPSGQVFAHSGTGTITARNNDAAVDRYIGVAGIVAIEGADLTSEISIGEISVSLNGVPNEYQWQLDADVRGSPASISFAYIDGADKVIDRPIPLKVYEMQYSNYEVTEDALNYRITGTPGILQIRSPTRALWSTEYQKQDFPNDTGFNFAEVIKELDLLWVQGELR